MVLSVSRRTDIPCYYSEWFTERMREGFVYVRNPMNPKQLSKIALSPDVVDCIVFWTKNPEPMLGKLDELSAYNYYFLFTLTGYGRDIEVNVPDKKKKLLPIFKSLSDRIGSCKVIWRYDPILFTNKYTPEYHLKAFEQIASALKGYTEKCVISFLDSYAKIQKNMEALGVYELQEEELKVFAGKLSEIAHKNDMEIATCTEKIDLSECGIVHNSCIDRNLIEEIIGCRLNVKRDKNQRSECGCVESIDIGTYNTCKNGCSYCYANYSPKSVEKNCDCYDVNSPLLCGVVTPEDKVAERKIKSFRYY